MNNELKQLLENYDKTGEIPVPVGGYTKENINNYQRADALIQIIDRVKDSLKEKFAEYGDLEIDVSTTRGSENPIYDAIHFEQKQNVASGKTDMHVCANFNLSKIAELPGAEAYSVLYYPLYNSILKNIEKKNEKSTESGKLVNQEQENQGPERLDPLVERYLSKSLSKIIGERIQIDDFSVQNIARELNKHGIGQPDLFDNPQNLLEDQNGEKLLAERFAKVAKNGYQQQATALLGYFSKDDFNSIRFGSDAQIKDFCEKFSDKFLQNSGIEKKDYEVLFSNSGDLGTYVDKGVNGQSITINIDAIRKMDNPAEVMMTLAHELTHMVDSSVNKGLGKVSRKGFGLEEHNLVGGVSENATGFVKRMEEVYYKANPHERSARQGELVALEFMMGMQPDADMKNYINKSLKSFQNYQRKTIETIKDKVEPLIREYQSGDATRGYDDKTVAYIDKVMADLIQMKVDGLLNFDKELNAIQASQEIENKDKNKNQIIDQIMGE